MKAIRESDPIPYSPEDGPYDPNDARAAKAYLSAAIIRRPGQRGKVEIRDQATGVSSLSHRPLLSISKLPVRGGRRGSTKC